MEKGAGEKSKLRPEEIQRDNPALPLRQLFLSVIILFLSVIIILTVSQTPREDSLICRVACHSSIKMLSFKQWSFGRRKEEDGTKGTNLGEEGRAEGLWSSIWENFEKMAFISKAKTREQLSRTLCGSAMLQEELTFSTIGKATAVEVHNINDSQ